MHRLISDTLKKLLGLCSVVDLFIYLLIIVSTLFECGGTDNPRVAI